MAKTALFLGGTGQIGRAAAARLLESGWEVVLASRGRRRAPSELDAPHVVVDRNLVVTIGAASRRVVNVDALHR